MRTSVLAIAAALAVTSGAAQAATFNDDFSAYGTATVLDAGDALFNGVWATTDGTVDLIAPPPEDFAELCRGTGPCVDLDGSSLNAGVFSTLANFAAGTYKLNIGLFGSLRGDTNAVTITLGNWTTTIANILSDDDASQSFTFTTTGGVLSFADQGNDNIGAVLTSVSLAAIPLPATLPLLAVGLGAFGLARKRRKA